MIFSKEKLDEIGRKLILRLRIDPGCKSKQYSNAYHDGIVIMCKAFQKEIIKEEKMKEELRPTPIDMSKLKRSKEEKKKFIKRAVNTLGLLDETE